MASTLTFLLESSPTPIYRRMTYSYQQAIERQGHRVIYFQPDQLTSLEAAVNEFLEIMRSPVATHLVIFDNSVLCTLQGNTQYLFEEFNGPLVFLHHDSLCNTLVSFGSDNGFKLLQAWQRVKSRSFHFCLEYSNYLDLRELGFENVYSIRHASEFQPVKFPLNQRSQLSFVGHLLPHFHDEFQPIAHLPYAHYSARDFWSRLTALETAFYPNAIAYAQQVSQEMQDPAFLERHFSYLYALASLSGSFRGELIKRIDSQYSIDIFGGDPGYLQHKQSHLKLDRPNITYHAPTADYRETQQIYADSKINLNITSLQFDDAVTNRVVDVGAVGGFILTDWRSDLKNITQVHEEISYRSIEDLNAKIDYYLSHDSERLEIAQQLHQDVMRHCTYDRVVAELLAHLQPGTEASPPVELVRLDIGCGRSKPAGFIGVDVVAAPGVDVVADLTRRFPFATSSVDYVRAYDVVEHLPDRIHTMNEIWRICKPGAMVEIRVPSTDGRGAFQDPTHISFWNINSFYYYAVESFSYLQLCQSYGFRGAFHLVSLENLTEDGEDIVHVKAFLQVVKPVAELPAELAAALQARPINLMIFPNWGQPEAAVLDSLTQVLRAMASHPQRREMTLLIHQGQFAQHFDGSLEDLLSSLALNLFLEEGLEVEEDDLHIVPIFLLTPQQYELTLQHISYRLTLAIDFPLSMARFGAQSLPTLDIDQLSQQQFTP